MMKDYDFLAMVNISAGDGVEFFAQGTPLRRDVELSHVLDENIDILVAKNFLAPVKKQKNEVTDNGEIQTE